MHISMTGKAITYLYTSKNIFINILVAIVVSLALFSCGSKSKNDKMVFNYNQPEGLATLDPAFAKNQSTIWVAHQIFNTLVETDSNMNIVPSLATRWDVSENRLIYTFHLREDVFFHDNEAFTDGRGRRMTAADVAYSLSRIQDKSVASSGAWIFNNRVDSIQPFIAIDDSTLQIRLIKPFHPILGILSMKYCSVVPHEVVDKYGKDFRSHPCGTGPFKFSFWEEGQALILHKNENYWEKDAQGKSLPYLDAVKISFLDSKATEFLAFQQGQLSFINDIDPSFKDEVLTKTGVLRKDWVNKVELHKHPFLNTEYLGILVDENNALVKRSPLQNRLLRQAINSAINREKLMMYMRNSIGIPANGGFVPAGLPSRNAELVKGYPYNPARAQQLLQQSGLSKSSIPQIKLLTIPIYADIASFVAKQLEEIGLHVQVEVVQKRLLLEQTSKSQALFFRGSWIADYPDAENYMAMFYSKNPAPPNYTRYNNPAFDALYETALTVTNDSARYELYRQMDQVVMNDAVVVPLWYDMAIHLVQKNVRQFNATALNQLELRHVTIQ
jgi:oligopeptide transport system substrate-binding protein